MTTALQIASKAYRDIQAQAANQPIPADYFDSAIEALNDLVLSEPTIPNYTILSSADDEITCPAYCDRWLAKALALELSPQYGTLESYEVLERQKKRAYSVILRTNSRIGPPQLNSNVPLGSGNLRPGNHYTDNFYKEEDNGILTETNQTVIVEDGTE